MTHFRTYFSGDWDVHWGYRALTHSHLVDYERSPLCGIPIWMKIELPTLRFKQPSFRLF